ncbi:MAG TPA: GNAT family N-acetyltransferase [Burkholderiaceae bacterium]|nr:GNAT family N-acetyltransferase [Burkholderiaceae bacterium]
MRLLHDPRPWLDAMAALDERTLRTHTEAAGKTWHPGQQRAQLEASLPGARFLGLAREQALLAYVLLRPLPGAEGRDWFVGMINTEPAHRDAALWRRLLAAVAELLRTEDVQQLHSHVYKTNAASLALHRRLGFQVVQENAQALAFCLRTADLLGHPLLRRHAQPA